MSVLKFLGIAVIGVFFIACQGSTSSPNKDDTKNATDPKTSTISPSTKVAKDTAQPMKFFRAMCRN
ncbi:hypothetical protein BKH43_03165 [Helicobacter sp. 13S00401-1]|uniref:hypothetical protein n=1 Tax=Helicobacter sp. 13S00401-1 TaxID=1905758 RepID=UPI000BA6CEC5|nr:hypothetical protein [Helicobacter sp. 13S00401-1]PAF51215.1 hypothetical protein BKH43_03165 [Helicobacter sp. 13S00401-1]